MTAPRSDNLTNNPTLPQRLLALLCCLVAMATAVLLWGVGAEAVHFGHSLSGALLLVDATLVTVLEAVTLCFMMLPRNSCIRFRRIECLSIRVDTYKRAILYALLTVTCFVRLDKYWLPALPGCALILSSVVYILKHCCNRKAAYDIDKMSSFVSFEGNVCLTPDATLRTDTSPPPPPPPPPPPLPLSIGNKEQHQPPLSIPTVRSAVNDYWREPSIEPPPSVIQQPPALPPRRNRPNRGLPDAGQAVSEQQHHNVCLINEDSFENWSVRQ